MKETIKIQSVTMVKKCPECGGEYGAYSEGEFVICNNCGWKKVK